MNATSSMNVSTLRTVKHVRIVLLLGIAVTILSILRTTILHLERAGQRRFDAGNFFDSQQLNAQKYQYIKRTTHNFTTLTDHYQSPSIQRHGCSVTVVMVDPDLGEDVQWALESVVANINPLHTTCFLLQTSSCMFEGQQQQQHRNSHHDDRSSSYQRKAEQVISLAQPGFRQMIQMGNVRMTILNHTKYHLRSCHNFYNPSYLFENIQYWGANEFIPQVDSDLVLIVQGDSVLCHKLNIDKWNDLAWVGAPWKPSKGTRPWMICSAQVKNWYQYHNVSQDDISNVSPPAPLYLTDDQMCSDVNFGPQGNGGLSIRSRSWLQKAIRYCPTAIYDNSGLSWDEFNATTCRADEILAEDLYFATILRGLGAPLPNVFEAALFAQELRSVGDILKHYKQNNNRSFIEATVQKRWYSDDDTTGLTLFQKMETHQSNMSDGVDPIIPIGLHKPWNPSLVKRINEDHLNEYCPYLNKVVSSSKYGKKYLL